MEEYILKNIECWWHTNKRNHVNLHRLITKQFLPDYSKRKPISHKNGDIFDNNLDNLTYKHSEVNKKLFIGKKKMLFLKTKHLH